MNSKILTRSQSTTKLAKMRRQDLYKQLFAKIELLANIYLKWRGDDCINTDLII